MPLYGPSTAPATTANISAASAAVISHTQNARTWLIVNKSAATLYVRMGGTSSAPAANDPDQYHFTVPVGTERQADVGTDTISIYNSGGSTATYGTDFSVHLWI